MLSFPDAFFEQVARGVQQGEADLIWFETRNQQVAIFALEPSKQERHSHYSL
jgi:hypothetical protein